MSTMPLPTQKPPEDPFQWGRAGIRLTPGEIMRQRKIADAQLTSAGSVAPIGHWTQGLARVLEGLSAGLANRRLAKAEAANTAESDEIAALLMPQAGGDPATNDVVIRALMNPRLDQPVRDAAKMIWEQRNQTPSSPHYWETNNGSLGMVGADGKPSIVYEDPSPKINWITVDNGDGTKTVMPMGQDGPAGGGTPPQPLPERPVGNLTPITGGGASNGVGGFPR